jgi:GNAT superfamily N-acetyltransferase
MTVRIRPLDAPDRVWVRDLLAERWGGGEVVAHGTRFLPASLPGWVAVDEPGGERLGVLCYDASGDACEIVLLDTPVPGRGAGTALLAAVTGLGHRRLWVVTTNDNTGAIAWYRRRGFRVVAVHHGAVDRARAELKASIPRRGIGGVEIHDEIELELISDTTTGHHRR